MKAAARLAALAVLLAGPAGAAAEEGLVVARVGGGVSSTRPTWPDLDQLWTLTLDYTRTQRAGVVLEAELAPRDDAWTLALGVGAKYLLVERMWHRIYVHAGPQLVIVWPDGDDARWDAALGGGLGYEYLMMWGFGVVVELRGTATAGRGPAEPLDESSAGATAGLFMEF